MKKADRKLSALTRICKFMSLKRRRVLMEYFIEFQFVYCPLVWMCYDKTSDSPINHLHEGLFTMKMCQHLKSFYKKIIL